MAGCVLGNFTGFGWETKAMLEYELGHWVICRRWRSILVVYSAVGFLIPLSIASI